MHFELGPVKTFYLNDSYCTPKSIYTACATENKTIEADFLKGPCYFLRAVFAGR